MGSGRGIETELMPRLVGGDAETVCSKLKRCEGFLKPNFGTLPKPRDGPYCLSTTKKYFDALCPCCYTITDSVIRIVVMLHDRQLRRKGGQRHLGKERVKISSQGVMATGKSPYDHYALDND